MSEKLTGFFVYGETYSHRLRGKSVPFQIEWTLTDGLIIGTSTDDASRNLFAEPATINGFIDNNIISFIKRYPKRWATDKNGNISIIENVPPHDIHYAGVELGDHFEGEWEMTLEEIHENEETIEFIAIGTWFLKKS